MVIVYKEMFFLCVLHMSKSLKNTKIIICLIYISILCFSIFYKIYICNDNLANILRTPKILIHEINCQYHGINVGPTSRLIFKYQELTRKFLELF